MAEEQVQITAILRDKFSKQSNTITKSIGGLDKSLSNLTKTLGPLASRFTALGAAFTGIGLSKLASDAEETQSKFNAVFKDLAGDVQVFTNQLATDVGRSRVALTGFLATLQDTFVPLGFARDRAAELSKELVTLAVDVASFNNVSDASVVASFQSAIVGNTEAVRKYGIVLTQARLDQEALNAGFEGGILSLTEAQKAQLRFNVILQSTQDAQGDAVRTQDSFQNSLKATVAIVEELGIALGSILNDELRPFLITVRDTVIELTNWVQQNKATIQAVLQLTGQVILAVAAFKGLLIIRAILPVLSSLGAVAGTAALSVGQLFTSLISLARGGADSAAGMNRNATAIRTFRRGLRGLKVALRSVGIGVFIALVTSAFLALKTAANTIRNVEEALNDSTKSFSEISEQIQQTRENLVELSESKNPFLTLSGQTVAAANRLEELNEIVLTRIEIENENIRATQNVIRSLRQQAEQTSRTAAEQRELGQAAQAMNSILAQQGNAARNATIALKANAGQLIDLFEKAIITEEELIALSKQRTEAIEGTVRAFIKENKEAAKLLDNAEKINALFDKFGTGFVTRTTEENIIDQIEQLDIPDRIQQIEALEKSLADLAETGERQEILIDIGGDFTDIGVQNLQQQINDVVDVLQDQIISEFFDKQASGIERATDALGNQLELNEQLIEKQRLLGEISDTEAAQRQQENIETGLKSEIDLTNQLLAVGQQKLSQTRGEEARAEIQKELNGIFVDQKRLQNDLIILQATQTNADLQAANTARDAFIARAQGLAEFVKAQQVAVDTGETTFDEAQQKLIDKQAELQKAFEETNVIINQTFGEGTELAKQYGAELTELNTKTQELEISSENAFTTLDRVLQQTTATLVNSLTSSMSNFFETIITGSKDGKQAFGDLLRDMAKNFARFAAETIAKLLIIRAISAFLPGGFAAQSVGQGVATGSGFNSGGIVPGGGPDRDSVSARLTPGEYVMPRKRVQQYGAGVMNALRQGLIPASMLRNFSSGRIASRGNALQGGGQTTDQSVGLQQSGEGLVLPVMQADDNNLETILNGGESAMMRFFERNNTQVKSILDSSER